MSRTILLPFATALCVCSLADASGETIACPRGH